MPTMLEINRDLANKLYDEAQRDVKSPYAGKKVGIANGKVVVVADDWNDIARALERAESDPMKTYCVDMAQDYKTVQYIWGIDPCHAPNGS